jgi:CRP/FNR family transcriptional regulator, cyclic AMP receptor protein
MSNGQLEGQGKYPFSLFFADVFSKKRDLNLCKNDVVYSQGDPAGAVYYIQRGQVKLTMVSFAGKEATLCILGPGDFFGVCGLIDQTRRLSTASTLEPTALIRIEKDVMMKSLSENPRVLEAFLAQVLKRTLNLQKDLCTQILDPSEKRLAKVLLRLAQSAGERNEECVKMPRISHETLATMVGTTRSRVTYFMNKFKDQGYIDYGKKIVVHPSQLSFVIKES